MSIYQIFDDSPLKESVLCKASIQKTMQHNIKNGQVFHIRVQKLGCFVTTNIFLKVITKLQNFSSVFQHKPSIFF